MNKKTKIISIILVTILMINSISIASFEPYTTTVYSKKIAIEDYYTFYKDTLTPASITVIEKDGVEYPAYYLYPTILTVRQYGSYDISVEGEVGSWEIWRIAVNGYPYKTPEQLGCANVTEAYIATQEAFDCILYNKYYGDFKDYYSDNETGKRIINAIKQIVADATSSTESPKHDTKTIQIQAITDNWDLDSIDNKYISKTYKISSINEYENCTININENMKDILQVVDLENNPTNEISYNEQFKILIKIEDIQDLMEFTIDAKANFENRRVFYGYTTIEGNSDYVVSGIKDIATHNLEDKIDKSLLNSEIFKDTTTDEKDQSEDTGKLPEDNKNQGNNKVPSSNNGQNNNKIPEQNQEQEDIKQEDNKEQDGEKEQENNKIPEDNKEQENDKPETTQKEETKKEENITQIEQPTAQKQEVKKLPKTGM